MKGTTSDYKADLAGRRYYRWMLNCGEVVIVSGPPGSGKTTVGVTLGSGCERGVHLESDWFFRFIRSGFI